MPLGFLWQECFTYVLKGHIAVSAAVFPAGTKGRWLLLSRGRLALVQAPKTPELEEHVLPSLCWPPAHFGPTQGERGMLHRVSLLDPPTELRGSPGSWAYGSALYQLCVPLLTAAGVGWHRVAPPGEGSRARGPQGPSGCWCSLLSVLQPWASASFQDPCWDLFYWAPECRYIPPCAWTGGGVLNGESVRPRP